MPRDLTEQEFNTAKDKALGAAPKGMTEEQFNRWWQRQGSSVMDGAIAEAEELARLKPEGTAGERIWNAVSAVPAGIGQMLRGVIDPVQGFSNAQAMFDASADQAGKASTAFQEGRYPEAIGHAVGAVPVVGAPLAQTGEQIASGDFAGGGANAAMLAGTALLPGAARAVRNRINPAALESGAASRVADVMSPKVGANKTRFGQKADAVSSRLAGELATDGAPLSRQTFHAEIGAKLDTARQALDAAADARLAADQFDTRPLINALMAKRRAATSQAVEASAYPRRTVSHDTGLVDAQGQPMTRQQPITEPLGQNTVSGGREAYVAQLDAAIDKLRTLGPVTSYEPIRVMRASFDELAKPIYNESVTADYARAGGPKATAQGAADVTGVLREELARRSPETAAANQQFSLYKSAKDVLDATAEVERTRPKLGRALMARLTGTILGAQAGPTAAVAGFVGGPILDQALASGVTTQLKTAAVMQRLATAIRSGNAQAITKAETAVQALRGELVAGTATTTGDSRTRTTRGVGAGPLGQGLPQLVAP